MATLTGAWRPIQHLPSFPRSSQTLSILHSSFHLFSGEHEPRVPLSAELHILPLNPTIPIAITVLASPLGPPPRVGAASAVLDDALYVFGGRGGPDMSPLVEGGRVWSFVAGGHEWTPLDPSDENAPFPEARSYHAATAGLGKIYIHAGCPGSGRLGDLWSFDVGLKQWEKLKDAPGDPRGGTAIAITGSREIWRFGGFNGSVEIGGVVDVYDIPNNTWRSIPYSHGPPARSVSSLVPIRHPNSKREYLITVFGEHDPSALGHAGAGKFLDGVWAYDIATAEWSEVKISGETKPEPRGWFAAGAVGGDDGQGVIVQGGLSEGNKRLGDWWLLEFD